MADIILGLHDFTMEVAKNMEEVSKNMGEKISSMHEEKQAFFLEEAKAAILEHMRQGLKTSKGWAEILAPEIISRAEHKWRIAHGEADETFIDRLEKEMKSEE